MKTFLSLDILLNQTNYFVEYVNNSLNQNNHLVEYSNNLLNKNIYFFENVNNSLNQKFISLNIKIIR